VRVIGGIGLAVALACAYPLARNLTVSVPAAQVVSCKVTFSHQYFVYVTLGSGQSLVLDRMDVPDAAKCLPPGTTVEKAFGEFGYRINGQRFFWRSEPTREYAMFMAAGLAAALVAFVSLLRTRRALNS
jgi:hypothetical protein